MALAKTTRPMLARTLPRPRLFRRLDQAGHRPVTWVWAPPGAGKTTAVASYLAARRQRVLWYQVDAGDADVGAFFYYLGQAAPARRRPLPLLTSEYRQGLTVFARRFFRELFGRLATPFAVVLDNYQEVPRTSELHEVMREAIEEIPERGRVIVLSRAEPPPAFARALVNEMVAMLDWSELRFTASEAQALMRSRASTRWSSAGIRSLYERTDGWCAGMILMLDQAGGDDGHPARSSTTSQEVLFDYFAGEIFKRAEPAVQDILMQTAFLPRVTPAMAEALTGSAEAGETLASLHRQNYFTNKQAGSPPTYEYHPLFREFLLARATDTYDRPTRAKICRTAATLLDEAGRIEEAARLLRDAEDWPTLTQLIHRYAQSLVAQGRTQTLDEWLTGIPPAIFADEPWLLFWRGFGWMAWRHTDCQRTLEQAFVAFRDRGDAIGMFLSWAGVVFALVSEGQVRPMDRWIALLDEILREAPEFPTQGVETRVATAMLVATSWRQPHHPAAARWAERAIELGRRHPDITTRAMAAVHWVHYQLQVGDLASAAVIADEMGAVTRDRTHSPVELVNARMPVVWYESFMALPSYRRTVASMLELVQSTGMFYTARHVILCGGLIGAVSDGDLETADAWLRELEVDVHQLGPLFRAFHHRVIVWQALIRGDVARAMRYHPEMLRLGELDGSVVGRITAHLTSAQTLHAHGDEPAARAALQEALSIASAMQSDYFEFMGRLIEAQLDLDADREVPGLQALRRALALGRQHGYVNSHVWIPADMARLCVHALRAGIETEYVRDLVRRRTLAPDPPPVEVEAWPWPVKIVTLGRFAVLRDGVPVRFARKVQRKPLALLKAIIAAGGRAVREDVVMDGLWPDAAGDAAHRALASALHRLRGLLGHEGAVVRQDGQLSIDRRACWVDVWAVEHLLARRDGADAERRLRRALDLYHGPFLDGEESELPQAGALAEGLRRSLLRHIAAVARSYEGSDTQRAAEWYEEGLRVDPCAEEMCRSLMVTYQKLGQPAAARDAYARCRRALTARLGSSPSAETDRLVRTLGTS
jgi:ATP/maltotriose-dependent transcriptional regulator MalT/DNA-binding SARP family transcriptional activator